MPRVTCRPFLHNVTRGLSGLQVGPGVLQCPWHPDRVPPCRAPAAPARAVCCGAHVLGSLVMVESSGNQRTWNPGSRGEAQGAHPMNVPVAGTELPQNNHLLLEWKQVLTFIPESPSLG